MNARWKTEWRCVNCHQAMSFDCKMASYGRCPACGFKGMHAITVVETYEVAYQEIRTAPSWMFWVKPERKDATPPKP